MGRWFRTIRSEFSSLLFPATCLKCRTYILTPGDGPLSRCFCPSCTGLSLPWYQPPFCTCCGRPFDTGDSHLCESCLKTDPAVGRVRAAFEYQGIIRDAVGLLKYRSRLSLATPFETCLFDAFATYFSDIPVDLILPVPLHPARARQRGFNQSCLLVRNFTAIYRKRCGQAPPWQVDTTGLVRVKPTPSQTGLDIREREKNLNRAFTWRGGRKKGGPELRGRHVLLVDDVYTTGATCTAAARALTAAGAARVDALVLARA